MSYNGYNQYSPYWQQSAGQDGRGQFSDQSRNNPAYQSNTCQPLTAYQNNQQRSQSSTPQNVGNGGAGDGRSQDSRAGYGNDRSPVDTTALGNLAYASTLGRDNSSQKIPDYSRQTSTGYSSASSYGISSAPPMQYRLDHERTESSGATAASREDLTARAQQATSSPSSGYSSNNGLSGYQAYNSVANVQTSSPCSRPSRALYASTNQPSRPTSGQAMQQSRSGLGSQAAPSATMPTSQAREYQSNPSNDSDNIHGTGQTRVQTPQQSTNTTPRPPAQPTYNPANIPNRHLTHDSSKESAAKRVDGVHQSSAVEKGPISAVVEQRLNNKSSKPATPVDSQATTVDPSQVFNHIEYTRRQAAAAAETAAKKGAEEARAAASVQTQPSSQPDGASASHPQYTVQQSIERSTSNMYVGPDSAKKDQMELEMKQMIEKMRDYKAKDPSLFSQIWEQVKKVSHLSFALVSGFEFFISVASG